MSTGGTENMEERIRKSQITRNLTTIKGGLTDADIAELQDLLIERGLLTIPTKIEMERRSTGQKVDSLLDIVFRANAYADLLEVLSLCGFEDLVTIIQNTEGDLGRRSSTYVLDRMVTSSSDESTCRRGTASANNEHQESERVTAMLESVVAHLADVKQNGLEMRATLHEMREKQKNDAAKHETGMGELHDKITHLNMKAERDEERYTTLQKAHIGLKEQLEEKQERLSELRKKICSIERENEELKETIQVLKKNEEILILKNTELKKDREESTNDNKKVMADLTKEKEKLQRFKELLQRDKEGLRGNIKSLESKVSEMSSQLKRNESMIEDLKKQKKTIKQDLMKANTEKNEMKNLLKTNKCNVDPTKKQQNSLLSVRNTCSYTYQNEQRKERRRKGKAENTPQTPRV